MEMKQRVMTRRQSWQTQACSILALIIAGPPLACGESDTISVDAPNTGDGAPVFAVGSTTFSQEGVSSYVALVPGLGPEVNVDYERVLELPAGGRIWGSTALPGELLAVNNETATVTRYGLTRSGELEPRETLGFSAHGITAFSAESGTRIDVVSPSKAYLFDGGTAQAVVFDPSSMVISGVIDLGALVRDGWRTSFGFSETLLRGEELVVFTFYEDMAAQQHAAELRLALVDTRSDTATVVADSRCPATYAMRTNSGDIYFSSDGRAAAYHRTQPSSTPTPCLLRLNAGSPALDPSFRMDLASLTGGLATGGLVPAGAAAAFVLALDEGLATISETTLPSELYGSRAWRWWRVDLGSESAGARIDSPGPSAGGVVFMRVDGESYANDSAPDYSSSTLFRTSAPGGPERGLTLRGVPINVLRLR
jgi:hypothetical protein